MQIEILIRSFLDGAYDERLLDIYADEAKISYQRERYINAIKKFEQCYKPGDVELFSAPGRSEIGGNHTDHQNGEVLAASVNLDTIGIVKKTDDNVIRLVSDNYDEIIIRLDDVSVNEKEKETTKALIKGVVSGFLERKYAVGGFQAYITSDVLIGAGLSSSAAFETLIGTILSGLYNCGKVSATEIAIIGQYAENVYFGKPCGLMDQMASSTGNLVHIDFANPENPQVEKIDFDMEKYGYRLCITDTKGSHADLTDEYAAVPKEMKLVAKYFGKKVLRDVSANDVLENIHNLREKLRIIDGSRFFGIHLFGGINAFLLEYNRFDHNGQETDNSRKKQSATGFSFKSFKSVGIRCRNKEVGEDKGCACYPKHDG